MDIKEWMQYGWPTVALLGVGLFIYKLGWPFMVRTLERAQEQLLKLTTDFTTALERRDELQRTRDVEFMKRLDMIVDRLDRRSPDR